MGRIDPTGQMSVEQRACQSRLERGKALGDRRAGANGDAGGSDAAFGDFQCGGSHGDRDHEITSGTELEKGAARRIGGSGDVQGDHEFAGTQVGAANTGDELLERQATGRGTACDLDLGAQRQQARHAICGRRGVAEIAGQRAGVLDLAAADLARGLLQAVEQRRQVGFDQLAPARGGTQPPASGGRRDPAQKIDGSDVEDVFVDRTADPSRIEVGAAGQHRVRPREGRQCLFQARRTDVFTHIVRVRTMAREAERVKRLRPVRRSWTGVREGAAAPGR